MSAASMRVALSAIAALAAGCAQRAAVPDGQVKEDVQLDGEKDHAVAVQKVKERTPSVDLSDDEEVAYPAYVYYVLREQDDSAGTRRCDLRFLVNGTQALITSTGRGPFMMIVASVRDKDGRRELVFEQFASDSHVKDGFTRGDVMLTLAPDGRNYSVVWGALRLDDSAEQGTFERQIGHHLDY